MTKIITKALLFITLFTVFLSPFSFVQKQNDGINNITIETNIAYATKEKIDDKGFLDCSQFDFACKGINFLQIIFVTGGNILVGISAFFMDTFLFHSIQSSSYRDSGFIVQGWEILRDLTNIVFIFALLSLAFRVVLDLGKVDARKQLIRVVIVSLTINFSLFFCFAIIDMSNILAFTFYNRIDQQEVTYDASSDGGENTTLKSEEKFKGKSTSLAIAAKINPQRLLNANAVSDDGVTKGQRVVMVLMAGVINGVLIFVFLSVSFLFLGRTIALWLTVVLAPLAFASLTIPGWEKRKYFGWDNWLSSLLQTSLMAPVFLFFLYLAVQFMKIDITFAGNDSSPFINNILDIIIPMAAIVVLLLTAKKVANSMAGDFAGTISGMVGKVVGGAVAVGSIAATGGAALAGGAMRGAGALASKSSNTTIAKIGNRTRNLGRGLQSTNFNFGQTRLGKIASKTTGIDMGARMGNISYMNAENKAFLGAAKLKESAKDFRDGRTSKEMEAQYEKEKAEIKNNSGKWQDTIHENKASEALSKISDGAKKSTNPNPYAGGKTYQEHVDETRKEVNKTANQATIKSEKEQVSILEEILKAEKEKLSTDVANAAPADKATVQAAGQAAVNTAKGNLDSFVATTIEGKFKRAEKDLEKATKAGFEGYATRIETSGENGGKKTAHKIRSGKIKPKASKKEDEK